MDELQRLMERLTAAHPGEGQSVEQRQVLEQLQPLMERLAADRPCEAQSVEQRRFVEHWLRRAQECGVPKGTTDEQRRFLEQAVQRAAHED